MFVIVHCLHCTVSWKNWQFVLVLVRVCDCRQRFWQIGQWLWRSRMALEGFMRGWERLRQIIGSASHWGFVKDSWGIVRVVNDSWKICERLCESWRIRERFVRDCASREPIDVRIVRIVKDSWKIRERLCESWTIHERFLRDRERRDKFVNNLRKNVGYANGLGWCCQRLWGAVTSCLLR